MTFVPENTAEPSQPNHIFRDLFAQLPRDYQQAAAILTELHRAFHRELATAVQPIFNDYLQTLPQETLVEKQALVTHANGELRRLGLTIKCPKTGNPAILIADFSSAGQKSVSRFRLQANDERGRRVRSWLSSTVPEVQLMADPPRRESFSRGYHPRGERPLER